MDSGQQGRGEPSVNQITVGTLVISVAVKIDMGRGALANGELRKNVQVTGTMPSHCPH